MRYPNLTQSQKLALLTYALLPFVALIFRLQFYGLPSLTYRTLTSSMLLIYITIHLLSVVRLEQQGTELVLTRQAYQEILYDAETDDLTGLFNRKVLLWEADKVLSSARETGCAIWMIDLDRFKDVNDEYGHSMGNQMLTAVAHKLISLFPADALVARYGGDELCVFFPQISLEGLFHILQQALTGFIFTCEKGSNVVQIAASLDAAYVPPECTITCQELFEQADEALYTSKNNERHLYSLKEL